MGGACSRPAITLWTVGHSNHPLGAFLDLLAQHRIEVVADVRSSPYSRYASQFNREASVRPCKTGRFNTCFSAICWADAPRTSNSMTTKAASSMGSSPNRPASARESAGCWKGRASSASPSSVARKTPPTATVAAWWAACCKNKACG